MISNKAVKIVFHILATLAFVACTKSPRVQFEKSVRSNAEAANIAEWKNSAYNPAFLFQKIREDFEKNPELAQEVCEALFALSAQELTLFETEINRASNSNILKDCRHEVKENLESYWRQQASSLPEEKLNFTMPVKIQKRDLSKEYRAYTGDVGLKELILTFDDGPNGELTPRILDVLKSVEAKVMFFHLGSQVRLHASVVHREALEGHILGSHSGSHPCLAISPVCTKLTHGMPLAAETAKQEIRSGHQAIYDALGFVDPFFRFPYGESDATLRDFLTAHQVGQVYWNIDSEDWRIHTNQELLEKTLLQIDKVQRGIVLFHDIQRRSLEILPAFLRAIYDRGYSLVILQSQDENARQNSLLVTKKPALP